MGTIVDLDADKLRQLSDLIYRQEVNAISSIRFRSEHERADYLRQCRANNDSVRALLDSGEEVRHQFGNADCRAPIAHDVFEYISHCCNSALQSLRNYTLRSSYLNKIRAHADLMLKALTELDPTNVINVRRLAKDAAMYRNCMLEYARKHQSPASRNFSRWLKDNGMPFDKLLQRYQKSLGYGGRFSELGSEEQLSVYNKIIEASGRGNMKVNLLSKTLAVAGTAVLLFTAGVMVWDIFSSAHVIQTAVHHAVTTAASIGGALLGEVIGTALASKAIGAAGSPLFLMMAGFVGGIAGAFILGSFIGWIVDQIFSGGEIPNSTDGHHCYVAPMPDATLLARQIMHA